MSPIEIAKIAANCVVIVATSKVTTNVLAANGADPDSIPVKATALTAGSVAGVKAKPYTDNFVDKAALKLSDALYNYQNR